MSWDLHNSQQFYHVTRDVQIKTRPSTCRSLWFHSLVNPSSVPLRTLGPVSVMKSDTHNAIAAQWEADTDKWHYALHLIHWKLEWQQEDMTHFIFQLHSNMFQSYNSLTSTYFKYHKVYIIYYTFAIYCIKLTDIKFLTVSLYTHILKKVFRALMNVRIPLNIQVHAFIKKRNKKQGPVTNRPKASASSSDTNLNFIIHSLPKHPTLGSYVRNWHRSNVIWEQSATFATASTLIILMQQTPKRRFT